MQTTNEKEYPFEVLYTDGSRSRTPKENKSPWGVIIGKGALSLKISGKTSDTSVADIICRRECIANNPCSSGNDDFWAKVASLGRQKLQELNDFIKSQGGDMLSEDIFSSSGRINIYDYTHPKRHKAADIRPVCML